MSHDVLIKEIKANTKTMEAGNKRIITLTEQRDALLEACEMVLRNLTPLYSNQHLCIISLKQAIAKAGEK